jgi:hypothetical protein
MFVRWSSESVDNAILLMGGPLVMEEPVCSAPHRDSGTRHARGSVFFSRNLPWSAGIASRTV